MRLSGGERQRISLARAFLKDAPILVLDEPTSAVDVRTEALIMEAMERLMSGRTTFMIAHRLSTLESCDLRLEVDAGRLGKRSRGERPHAASAPEVDEAEHPAAAAWTSLGGAAPRHVEVLKASKRQRRPGVYRLHEAGGDGGAVIAKLCRRKTAEIENAVYADLLPELPLPSCARTSASR